MGDAALGLVCMLLLLLLRLLQDRLPLVHREMPLGARLSHGLLWTVATGEGLPAVPHLDGLLGDAQVLVRGHSSRHWCHWSGCDLGPGMFEARWVVLMCSRAGNTVLHQAFGSVWTRRRLASGGWRSGMPLNILHRTTSHGRGCLAPDVSCAQVKRLGVWAGAWGRKPR